MAEPSSPAISVKLALKCSNLEAILHDTFLSISSLQEALHMRSKSGRSLCHSDIATSSPAAQEKAIFRELKKLSELKHRYHWQGGGGSSRYSSYGGASSACLDGWVDEWSPGPDDVGWRCERVGDLRLELQKKDAEIRNLNATVERLVAKKEKLERRVRKLVEKKGIGHGCSTLPTRRPECSWEHPGDEKLAVAGHEEEVRVGGNVLWGKDEGIPVPLDSPQIQSNGVSQMHNMSAFLENNGVSGKYNILKNSPITPRKPSNGVLEKQRKRGDIAVPTEKLEMVELRRVVEGAVAEVRETTAEFGKAMAVHLRRAKWVVEEEGVQWVDESHKILAVHSYVCLRMFKGFEHEDFYMSGRLSWLLEPAKHREECRQQFEAMAQMLEEPLDLLTGLTPDSAFGQFCRKKFLQILPVPMEEALLGDLQHRRCLVQDARHPRWSRFYQTFVRMAKAVWMVHKLAFSLEPRLSILQAEKGSDFSTSFMVSHIPNLELASDTHNLLPKVAFTVMPGFRIGDHILLRCHVYLNGMKASTSPANSGG